MKKKKWGIQEANLMFGASLCFYPLQLSMLGKNNLRPEK